MAKRGRPRKKKETPYETKTGYTADNFGAVTWIQPSVCPTCGYCPTCGRRNDPSEVTWIKS